MENSTTVWAKGGAGRGFVGKGIERVWVELGQARALLEGGDRQGVGGKRGKVGFYREK